jgi:hypothetical protein
MSQIQKWILWFVILLAVTAYCSYIGDDDVVYKFLDRKPTPREGMIRIRWVLLKTFTSIYGGALLSVAIGIYGLRNLWSIHLSKNQAVLLALVCIAPANLMIGVLQNEIRRLTSRPKRPLIDGTVWKHNLRQWRGKS